MKSYRFESYVRSVFIVQLPSAIRRRINIKVAVLIARREKRRRRKRLPAATTDGKGAYRAT